MQIHFRVQWRFVFWGVTKIRFTAFLLGDTETGSGAWRIILRFSLLQRVARGSRICIMPWIRWLLLTWLTVLCNSGIRAASDMGLKTSDMITDLFCWGRVVGRITGIAVTPEHSVIAQHCPLRKQRWRERGDGAYLTNAVNIWVVLNDVHLSTSLSCRFLIVMDCDRRRLRWYCTRIQFPYGRINFIGDF